jgi:hypothetical protein
METNKEWTNHHPPLKKHKGIKKINDIKNLNIVKLYKTENNHSQNHES